MQKLLRLICVMPLLTSATLQASEFEQAQAKLFCIANKIVKVANYTDYPESQDTDIETKNIDEPFTITLKVLEHIKDKEAHLSVFSFFDRAPADIEYYDTLDPILNITDIAHAKNMWLGKDNLSVAKYFGQNHLIYEISKLSFTNGFSKVTKTTTKNTWYGVSTASDADSAPFGNVVSMFFSCRGDFSDYDNIFHELRNDVDREGKHL